MITVIKATGEKEPFREEKVRNSIQRAGLDKENQDKLISFISSKLYDNIPTSEIYHYITEYLHTVSKPHIKAKYSLKQAIMALGPTGYPFEDFVSEMLKTQGFITEVRSTIQGKCISHEVDVVASKNKDKIMVEAKFHNLPGIKTNVHVALYTKARFEDIQVANNFTFAWLVTNTKITSDAVEFALCSNMKIISWSYPLGEGLRDIVEKSGLHPITALSSLSFSQKQKLLALHIVLCKDIVKNKNLLDVLELDSLSIEKLLAEAKYMCESFL